MATSQRRTHVDAGNREQAHAWDGTEGDYWAAHAHRFDRSMAGYQDAFLVAAAVRRGDRVLDIGCGAGQTTCDAARAAVGGHVLGVDLSARMLQVARARATAAGLRHVQFEQGDAQVHPFGDATYDVVLSRTGAMFFGDPVAAFGNLRDATRAGGRLVLLTWRTPAENEWTRAILGALSGPGQEPPPVPDGPGPFSLSDPDRIRAVLGTAGWMQVRVAPVEAPMWFGSDAADALKFLRGLFAWLLDALEEPERREAVDRLRQSLAAHAGPGGVTLGSSAWLITAQQGSDR
jgi:SAM-dependent methyltransferase